MRLFPPLSLPLGYLVSTFCAAGAIDVELVPGAQSQEPHRLTWQTEPGMLYSVQTSTDLENWETLPDYPKSGTGELASYDLGLGADPEFFRIISTEAPPEQLLNLPLPEDGRRYKAYDDFDGPRWPENYGEGHVTLWHKGKFAAYSITIDDNNTPDFPFWLEVAEDYGWKLTWFVILHPYTWNIYENKPGTHVDSYYGSLEDFAELAALGHDIQLHGSCGPMNTLTAEEYEDHIVRSIEALEGATGKPVITFGYPCGTLGYQDPDGVYHDYRGIIEKYMIAARGTTGGVTPVHLLDYLNTRSLSTNYLVNGQPSATFLRTHDKRAFASSQYRGWCVTLYHGLKDDTKVQVRELLDYVKANEDQYWVAPFTDVAKYAQERESAKLRFRTVEADRIEFTISDRMDDSIFDHPLTVKIRLSEDWTSISASQNGNPIHAHLVQHQGATYAMVEPIPDRGPIVLTPTAQ